MRVVACLVCAGCGVHVDRWAVPGCEVQPSPSEEDFGVWEGELVFRQSIDGSSKQAPFPVTLPDANPDNAALGLAPTDALPSMGFFGDWGTYSPGGPPSLNPLWKRGGNGADLYAYNSGEADGPANLITVRDGEICETDSSFEWRATVEYAWVDLFQYSLYAYEDSNDIVTLKVHEVFEKKGDDLVVRSISEGELEDGTRIEMSSTGRLTR